MISAHDLGRTQCGDCSIESSVFKQSFEKAHDGVIVQAASPSLQNAPQPTLDGPAR